MKNAATEAGLGIRDFAPPEGECWKDVNNSAKDFIQNEMIKANLLTDFKGKQNILIVSHGGFIMEFLNSIKYF